MFNRILLVVTLVLVGLEVCFRLLGCVDYPLYDANSVIGYIPKASQSGQFMNSHDWQFNALHMGASEFKPSTELDTLLIGDSIVLGGNPLKQQDRLGPLLEKSLGGKVWPISAGSWSLRNELIYLKQNPQVVESVEQIIFVLNSGDFDKASSWACEETHPRTKPIWATLYLFKKYVYTWSDCQQVLPAYKVPEGDWHKELAAFVSQTSLSNKKLSFFLYPNKQEDMDGAQLEGLEKFAPELHAIAIHSPIYSVARDTRWKLELYRDLIHPQGEGDKALAQIIAHPQKAISLYSLND